MTKILFVMTTFKVTGGVERSLISLLSALPSDKYDIDLMLINGEGSLFNEIPSYVNVLPFMRQFDRYSEDIVAQLEKDGLYELAEARRRVKLKLQDPEFAKLSIEERYMKNWEEDFKDTFQKQKEYDIAVAYWDSIPLKIVSDSIVAKKKIAWIHSDYNTRIKNGCMLKEHYFKNMDKIVCVGNNSRLVFNNLFPALSDRTITIQIILPINNIYSQASEYYPMEYSKDKCKICTSARIDYEKGADLLIAAGLILKERKFPFVWCSVGALHFLKGDFDPVRMVDDYGLKGYLYILGYQRNPYPYYSNCDIYVHPSRTEAKSVAVDEAKLFNVPILVTNYGSANDAIEDNVTGIICKQDPIAIADSIMSLYNKRDLRATLAKNALKRITEEQSSLLDKYYDLLTLN